MEATFEFAVELLFVVPEIGEYCLKVAVRVRVRVRVRVVVVETMNRTRTFDEKNKAQQVQ